MAQYKRWLWCSMKMISLTSREIFLNLATDLPFHERRLAEREVRRHAPVPDLRRRQRFVEGVGLVETFDHLRVCGRDDVVAAVLVGVRGSGWLACRPASAWRGVFDGGLGSGSGGGWC